MFCVAQDQPLHIQAVQNQTHEAMKLVEDIELDNVVASGADEWIGLVGQFRSRAPGDL